jgi:hypothetical protein
MPDLVLELSALNSGLRPDARRSGGVFGSATLGVEPLGKWPARLRLRCGTNRYFCRGDHDYDRFCHATDVAHYNRVLTRANLVGGAAV